MRRTDTDALTEDPTAKPPERRWTARYGPTRRGRPSIVKTVAHMPGGWPMAANEPRYRTHKVCSSIASRILAGDRTECPSPTVWRVEVLHRGLIKTAYWCDEHLPEQDRPADALF